MCLPYFCGLPEARCAQLLSIRSITPGPRFKTNRAGAARVSVSQILRKVLKMELKVERAYAIRPGQSVARPCFFLATNQHGIQKGGPPKGGSSTNDVSLGGPC